MSWCDVAPKASLEDLLIDNVVGDAPLLVFFVLVSRDENPQSFGICHSGAGYVELSMGEERTWQIDTDLYRYCRVICKLM